MSDMDSGQRQLDDLQRCGLHADDQPSRDGHADDAQPAADFWSDNLRSGELRKSPLVVSVVGLHNAGKTTIGERLVEGWRQMGLRVGVIKHDGHADDAFARAAADPDGENGAGEQTDGASTNGASEQTDGANPYGENTNGLDKADRTVDDWEKPGSDTHRYRARGAAFTMVTGGGSTLLRSVHDRDVHNITQLIERLTNHALILNQPLDIVLVEGYKKSDLPKVVVLRNGDEKWLLEANLTNVHAIVTNQMELTTRVADHWYPVYDEGNLLDLCHGLWTRDAPGGGE